MVGLNGQVKSRSEHNGDVDKPKLCQTNNIFYNDK